MASKFIAGLSYQLLIISSLIIIVTQLLGWGPGVQAPAAHGWKRPCKIFVFVSVFVSVFVRELAPC